VETVTDLDELAELLYVQGTTPPRVSIFDLYPVWADLDDEDKAPWRETARSRLGFWRYVKMLAAAGRVEQEREKRLLDPPRDSTAYGLHQFLSADWERYQGPHAADGLDPVRYAVNAEVDRAVSAWFVERSQSSGAPGWPLPDGSWDVTQQRPPWTPPTEETS
jgi:hypothetical protein